jgi:hypothetical protein
MNSCRSTRRHLLDVVRGTATDAVRLEVESHLEECVSCQVERGHLGLLGVMKAQPPSRLAEAAERRIVSRLVTEQAPRLTGRGAAFHLSHRKPRAAFAVAALTTTLLAFGLHLDVFHGDRSGLREGQRIQAAQPGTISFGGAKVAYEAGTTMIVHPRGRNLSLSGGEIEVDVTEGLPGRFRVSTPGFVVEVLGTRFVVTPTSVHTLRGHVRILDLREREMVVLHAGESWSPPRAAPPSAGPGDEMAATAPPQAVLPSMAPPASPPSRRPSRTIGPRRPTVSDLLSQTRAALADGDSEKARTFIEDTRSRSLGDADAAALELLEADAWLVGGHPDEAISAYRQLFRRRPSAPEGEMAAFTVGQLLAERAADVEAMSALNDYLAHYPQGRFVREARERLVQLQTAK